MRAALAGVPVLFALSAWGCGETGPENPNSYEVDTESGTITSRIEQASSGSVTMRSGPALAVALPADFTAYPGASITNTAIVDTADGMIAVLEMESGDPPVSLAEFYLRQAKAAGIEPVTRFSSEDEELLSGRGENTLFALTAIRGDKNANGEQSDESDGTPLAYDSLPVTRATLTVTQ